MCTVAQMVVARQRMHHRSSSRPGPGSFVHQGLHVACKIAPFCFAMHILCENISIAHFDAISGRRSVTTTSQFYFVALPKSAGAGMIDKGSLVSIYTTGPFWAAKQCAFKASGSMMKCATSGPRSFSTTLQAMGSQPLAAQWRS